MTEQFEEFCYQVHVSWPPRPEALRRALIDLVSLVGERRFRFKSARNYSIEAGADTFVIRAVPV